MGAGVGTAAACCLGVGCVCCEGVGAAGRGRCLKRLPGAGLGGIWDVGSGNGERGMENYSIIMTTQLNNTLY